MRIRFSGTVPKDEPSTNEDAFFPHEPGTTERVALSDGASESYASRKLATLLVKNFVDPLGDTDFCIDPFLWVDNIRQAYNKACGEFRQMSWSQQGAFERGSFATLLAFKSDSRRGVRIFWVGDSCVVLLDDGKFRYSVPYDTSAEFQQRPELISTIPRHNDFLRSNEFLKTYSRWCPITRKTIILCMTDALAEWALRRKEKKRPVWETLCRISDQAALEALVEGERKAREMRVDDSTLLVIDFTDEKSDGISDP